MDAYRFLGRFDNVKECACNAQGDRQWSARCPAHADRVNSLHIALSGDGKILLNCKAGCEPEDIVKKIGLRMQDLFPDEKPALHAAAAPAAEEDVYHYNDIAGGVPLRKHRMRNADGSKFFWWERFEDGRWQRGLNGLIPNLFGLDSVRDSSIVFAVEGEKDVKTVNSFDLPCVSAPDGGGKRKNWHDAYDEVFRSRRVYILPDNDGPGRDYARFLYDHVKDLAEAVFILNLKAVWPEMPEKADITDMAEALGKAEAYHRLAGLSVDADAGVLSAVLSPEELCRDASPAPSEAAEAASAEEDWTRTLERWSTPPHAVKQTLENHLIIMRNEPFYRNLRFNRLSMRAEIHENGTVRNWNDTDDAKSQHLIEKHFGIYSPKKHTQALDIYLHEHEYNPLFDLVTSVVWDGKNRIEHFLPDILKAEDSAYVREISRLLFAGGIHRLMTPGCRFDEMIVLTGDQGTGKSTVIEWLAMKKEFHNWTQNMSGDHDSIEKITGRFIVEVPELTAIRGISVEKIKAFLSISIDNYRLPYDRHVSALPRTCILIGTDNSDRFLRDKTGNRRFYPVAVHSSIVELMAHEDEVHAYIAQCWAEAYVRWLEGTIPPFPDPALTEEFRRVQENAMEDDWRVGAADEYLSTLKPGDFVCTRMVIDHLFPTESELTKQKMTRDVCQILNNSKLLLKTDERRYLPAPYGRQRGWLVAAPHSAEHCA
jgi:5S rRNA maturation endonuclease (ribonuclease M5)